MSSDELANESAHLQLAEACLVQMRAATEAIGDAGGDEWTSQILGRYRARRLAALTEGEGVPAFFGRTDFAAHDDQPAESFHIGRRHIRDAVGDPVVIDWRAPMAEPFYQATADEPMYVERRRRFGFHDQTLTSFEDELLTAHQANAASQILLDEIERPRVGPMRDIVATIQPDQDSIVRSPLGTDLCVQGAPGTGKTAVGLHRAAYLLYRYAEQLRRSRVLIVGPNDAFLSYIGAVLPTLGEFNVDQVSVEQITDRVRVSGVDPAHVAKLKGDARLAAVIERALRRKVTKPADSVQVELAGRRYRVEEHALKRYVDDLRRSGIAYNAARDRLALAIAEDARRQNEAGGGSPSDGAVRRTAKSDAVQRWVESVWPKTTAAGLIFGLLSDPDALKAAASGLLDEHEIDALLWSDVPRSGGRARWSIGDAVLVDEAAGLLERVDSYGHVVIDEAQDLSPMQCRAIARRCANGSMTVLGDIAQGTSDWASSSWTTTLAHLGRPDAHIEHLTLGYRVPGEIIDYANRLLSTIAPELLPGASVRPGRGSLVFIETDEVHAAVVAAGKELEHAEGTTGIICADARIPDLANAFKQAGVTVGLIGSDETNRVDLVPATIAKGFEFDHVVLVEPSDIVAAEDRGLNRLFVCLTRAVTSMRIIHQRALP